MIGVNDMTTTKQLISNQVWYDEKVNSRFDQRYDWCLEHLGTAQDYPPRWSPGELGHPLNFRFRDPADEVWFRLHWGS
jgi:hypothetical protein